jgi:hypothetical protein
VAAAPVASAGPDHAAVSAPQHECGERAAVVQVDADPVPADRALGQQLVAPFMVQPAPAGGAALAAALCQGRLHRQLRLAVVVAGVLRQRSLARMAGLPLQQQRLGRCQVECQREAGVGRGQPGGVVAVAGALQAPGAERDAGITAPGVHVRQRLVAGPALNALRVAVLPAGDVGDRGMREQQLARGEAAGQVGGERGAAAEEGDLPTDRCGLRRFAQPAGRVPPLDAGAGVRTMVARKAQRALRRDGVVVRWSGGPRRQGRGSGQQREPRATARVHAVSFALRAAPPSGNRARPGCRASPGVPWASQALGAEAFPDRSGDLARLTSPPSLPALPDCRPRGARSTRR